MKSAWFWS